MTTEDVCLALGATILGSLISVPITWFFSCLYYQRSAYDLRRESKNLRTNTTTIIRFLQQMHPNLTPNFDADGNATSITFTYMPSGITVAAGAAETTVSRATLQNGDAHQDASAKD
jgi:hypothetical protein